MSSRKKQYTDAEKAAYYKRKAQMVANPARPRRARSTTSAPRPNRKNRYSGIGRSIGGGLGAMAGNYLVPGVGGVVGGALGSAIGQGAQSLVKSVTGFGDYNVKKNSLVYNSDAVPEFSVNNERCTMVCHREFITDIQSSQSFLSREFRINPGVATTFPWLSEIAQNYEQYVVQGMLFEFKSTSATAVSSTNTTLGTVVLATQYNSLSPSFVNKQQMENYEFSQSTVPSQSVLHAIECDPHQTQCGGIFNIFDPVAQSGDTRLYDVGRFTIATTGMQADNAVVGELWVSYKICLLKPRLASSTGLADFYQLDAASITQTTPLGNLPTAVASAYNDKFTSLSNTNRVNLSNSVNGVFMVTLTYHVSSFTANVILPYVAATVGCTTVTDQYTACTNTSQSVITSTQLYGTQVGYIKKNVSLSSGLSSYFTITAPTIIAGTVIDAAYLSIISVPANMITDPFP